MICAEQTFDHTCDDCVLPEKHLDPGDFDSQGGCCHGLTDWLCTECGAQPPTCNNCKFYNEIIGVQRETIDTLLRILDLQNL
jgi:hypothetical protein